MINGIFVGFFGHKMYILHDIELIFAESMSFNSTYRINLVLLKMLIFGQLWAKMAVTIPIIPYKCIRFLSNLAELFYGN